MKNLRIILIGLTLLSGISSAVAQFSIPVSQVQANKECYVITNDGTKLEGKWSSAVLLSGYMSSIAMKDAQGTKHKFKAGELQHFAFKPGKASAFEAITGGTGGHMRFSAEDMEKIMDREWIHYVKGSKKAKSKKARLLQSLNAGWETPIQVFVDPNAKEGMGVSVGGMSVVGGRAKSYLIKKNGEDIFLSKGKYKKQSKELYGDCPEFKEAYPENLDWKDFPMHVFTYNQLMTKK